MVVSCLDRLGQTSHNIVHEDDEKQHIEDTPLSFYTTPRPSVKPVYGLCGHIARSENRTCGAYTCTQMYE